MAPNITGLANLIFDVSKTECPNREKLREDMERRNGWAYLLQGRLDGDILVLIPDSKNSQFVLAKDTFSRNIAQISDPATKIFFGSLQSENYQSIILDIEGLNSLVNVYAQQAKKMLVSKGTCGGRPQQYSMEDAKRWSSLRKQGRCIKEIARSEKVAENTIRKWLRNLDTMALMEKPFSK